ncbi:hypothetical protein C8J56DRAFT_834130 [Mycena floridula]|nr:hypothetical protein C8J56DRAFT_834130 [Mycena floridula]
MRDFRSMSSSDSDVFKSLRKHEEYYLSGGDLFFLVEHVHFRVHRYFFERESKFFQSKLCSPASPGGQNKQGTSESSAIFLDDVKHEDFARFLWVFYNSKYSLYYADVADWTAILDLAFRWEFPEVQNLAVRELEKLDVDDITRIVIYQKYNVDRTFLIPRYASLCQREATISLEEGMKLGMETTLNIVRARECARSPSGFDGTRSPVPANIDAAEMGNIIKSLFNILEPLAAVSESVKVTDPAPDASTTTPAPAASATDENPFKFPVNGNGRTTDTEPPATPTATGEPSTPTVPGEPEATANGRPSTPAKKQGGRNPKK